MAILERQRMRFTQEIVTLMLDANLIGPHDYELIYGDLIEKMPQNQPHSSANDNGYDALTELFGRGFVQHSAPILISPESAPEPDLAVLKQHRRYYSVNPSAADCSLVVEVSDTTLRDDKTTKKTLYALAGIAEYWIVNLINRTLIVHREPVGDDYQQIQTLSETDFISPLAASTQTLLIAALLP